MLNNHAKLISAIAASGEIVGRKKLQKMIYIAKKRLFPFDEKFEFHFYGPYSEELTLRIEELGNLGFLKEIREEKGNYYQYRYSVTKSGKEFLENQKLEMPDLTTIFTDLNKQTARFLELVSTILYFDHLSQVEVTDKIATLKSSQRYTDEEIEAAYAYIEKLDKA